MGLASTCLGMNTTYGVYASFYLQNNHFSGGSTFRYAWVGGLSVAFALFCAPLANWLLRRIDFRGVMLLGEFDIPFNSPHFGVGSWVDH